MKPLLAVFLPLLVAYGTALNWCMDRWNAPTEYFAHCWLVPPAMFVMLRYVRTDWRLLPRRVDRRGWWLLGPALLLHFAGAALMIDSWSAASIVLAVPGAAWLALGAQRLRNIWAVLWLVLFCVPMPIYVEGRLAFGLKEVAVRGGSWLANSLGAEVVRQGDQLLPVGKDGFLFVADACGGLRSLLAMLTLGYCIAFFVGPPRLWRRVVLLASVPLLAVVANVLRITSLCLMARFWDVPFAEGTGHTIANVVEWGGLLASLLALDHLLSRREQPDSEAATVPGIEVRAAGSDRGLGRIALTLWLLAPALLALSLYRPFADAGERAERLPQQVAGYRMVERSAEEERKHRQLRPRWRELLGTDDFTYRQYRDERQNLISLVALFHDTNWKSVHPPRICIEGSNMTIEGDDLVASAWLGDDAVVSRIVARSRSNGWRYVTLSVFGTADWASGDYWRFTMHHLPLALLRRNESGFLLRVESPIYDGEDAAVAEARCSRFLQQLLPMTRSLLR